MANNLIQVKRTSVSGRAANSTTLPNPGELALNMTDGILYSTNGSTVFEVGANNTNSRVTGTLTVNAISANGGVGSNNQRLTSNGSSVHWQDPLIKDLTDVAANGATDTQVLTYNSTLQKWINQNPPVANVIYTTGYYGVFYDLAASQYATGGSNTATVLQIANTYLGNGITRTSNNELQIGYAGVYQIQYSIQFTSSSNKNESIWVWLRKNGTDVPDSTTDFGIYPVSGGANGYTVAVTPLLENAAAGDKFQLMWATTSNSAVSVITETTTAFAPVTPGVIISVIPITNIITAPPGANTDVVFNDSGVSNAAAGFTFTKTTNSVFVANNLYVGNTVNAAAFTVDGTFWANSTVVNSASFQVNGSFTANSTFVNAAALLVRGGATVNGTLTVNAISANGGVGSPGQLLYSDGTKVYWNAASSTAGTNVDAQYVWTNTHTFQNTITFGNTSVNGTINSTSVRTTNITGNLTGNVVATTISGNLTGNVTATTISGNLTGNVAATTISGNLTGNVSATNVNASSNVVVGNSTVFVYSNTTAHVGNVVATAISGNLTGNVTATTISGNLTGNVSATTITGNLTGNVVATTISGNLTGNVIATSVFATSNVSVGNSTVNVYANNTAFVGNLVATSISGNLTGNVAATTISGNLTGNVVATTISGNLTGNVTATIISGNLTGNVVASTVNATSNVSVGNSTINVYANTTAFVGNVVATTISGNLTGNVTATTISGNLTGNVAATTISGNLTGNVTATTISGNLTGNVVATTISGNLTGNVVATLVSVGNSTVNVFANTTTFVGNTSGVHTGNVTATTISGNLTGNVVATTISGNLTGNVVATTITGNLTGNVVATTVNATTINATANIVVGSNMLINTTAIQVGNSTVKTTINTTAFVGNVVATTLTGNLTGNVAATTITGNLTGNVAATTLSGNLTAITANVTNKLQIGAPAGFDFGSNAVIEADANGNTYVQFVIQNANTGNNASTDMVLTNDTGNDSVGYVDLGINGSNYNQPGFNITGAGDAYLYAANGHLAIGTASDKEVILHAGGTTSDKRVLTINSSAAVLANAAALVANGSKGTAAQVLTANGTGAYWSSSVNNALNLGGVAAASYQLNSTLNANIAAYLPTYTGVVNASTLQVGTAFKANTTDVVTANLTVQGNLIVTGTTVTLNTATLDVMDLNITLAKGTATAAAANGAGITVDVANAEIVYINASNTWLSNINFGVGNSTSNVSINSTAFIGNVVASRVTANLTGNVTATTITGNLTGNVAATTISGNLTGNVAAITITGNLTGNVAATTISGNLTGNVAAVTITGNLTGNVVATTVNATTINATANIVVGANVLVNTSTLAIGNTTANVFVNSTAFVGNTVGVHTGNVIATTLSGNLTGNVAAITISGNLTGNVAAITITGNLTGNVAATTITGNLTGNVVATTINVATSILANASGFFPASNTVGSTFGNTTARWVVSANTIDASGDVVINGNVAINTTIQTDTSMYMSDFWATDTSTYGIYVYGQDTNTSITAIRSRYGLYGYLTNRSQNKNADGVTTYNSNYRAVVGDALNGSSSSGGNAFASEVIGGNFRSYQYANGTAANTINNAVGSRNQTWQLGSGVITGAYGTQSQVSIGNTTVTGNITSAYGVYSSVTSNTGGTIGNGYLFYGEHLGATTTTKWGAYVTGETKNYFSGNTGIGNTSPTDKLSVNGTTYLGANLTLISTAALIANGSAGTAGHVLHSNGTAVYWAVDDQGVTSVASGNGLTGGTITSTGTLSVVAGTGTAVNSTGVHVNATYIGTLSSNNATYLNGQLASYYTNATNITTGTLPVAQINTSALYAFTNTHSYSVVGNQLLLHPGANAPTIIHRNDGSDYYILMSAAGTVPDGGFSTFRPFRINLTSGLVVMANGVNISGGLTLGSTSLSANGSNGTAGHVLHSNGTATYWAADDQGVTSVAAGTGLSGGTITSTGTLSVNASYIATISANNASFLGTVAAASYARLDASGTFAARMTASAGQSSGSLLNATGSLGGIEVYGGGTSNAAFMCFHRPGAYASYFGIDTDNNFAVGGWSAGAALGLMKVGSLGVGTASSGTAGEIRATNNITAYYSDKRLKTEIKEIEDALTKVNKISGVTFVSNEEAAKYGYTDKKTQVGVIAQEIEAVLPEVVVPAPFDIAKADDGTEYSKSGQNYKTVQYEKLVPLLIEAIKELTSKVQTLEEQIEVLKK